MTEIQTNILEYVKDYSHIYGYQPSFEEMATHFKMTKGGIHYHLKSLIGNKIEIMGKRAIKIKEA